ncbi:hypothetical protein AIOL_001740 [Candidatus Rhodobacter oscarellae]|uniref:Uncharacterized protein n=1 Tax=Candidatus Rhodobacter oscarellae TaxID=1675527 RepID=A0A0J9E4N5_9RHOB|nr:hypothetical protein AIOL_001740 [Candidatus Rhodobacter lobularis]
MAWLCEMPSSMTAPLAAVKRRQVVNLSQLGEARAYHDGT